MCLPKHMWLVRWIWFHCNILWTWSLSPHFVVLDRNLKTINKVCLTMSVPYLFIIQSPLWRRLIKLLTWCDDIDIQCKREGFVQKIKDEEGEGCNIHGSLEVNKVAGNFHLAPGKSFRHANVLLHDLLSLEQENYNVRSHSFFNFFLIKKIVYFEFLFSWVFFFPHLFCNIYYAD